MGSEMCIRDRYIYVCAYTTYTQFPAHTYMYTITAHLHHGHIYMLCHAGYHGRFAASPPITGLHRIPATGTAVTVISRHRRRHRRLHRCRRSCRRRSCRRRCRSQLRFDPQQELPKLSFAVGTSVPLPMCVSFSPCFRRCNGRRLPHRLPAGVRRCGLQAGKGRCRCEVGCFHQPLHCIARQLRLARRGAAAGRRVVGNAWPGDCG